MLPFSTYEGKVKEITPESILVSIKRDKVVCPIYPDKSLNKGQFVKVKVAGIDIAHGTYKGHIMEVL